MLAALFRQGLVCRSTPQHKSSRALVDASLAGYLPTALVPQALLEFFAVVTSQRRVPHPLTPALAWAQVTALRAGLPVLDVAASSLDDLGVLVTRFSSSGGRVFDHFLASQMRAHRIGTICTYNVGHFSGIPGIEAITPEEALARWHSDNEANSQRAGVAERQGEPK
jgi:predicted nucleic acid-binding protein